MLKIKDDVDLKELEKLGFEKENNGGTLIYEKWYRSIGYVITKDRIIHKLKDLKWYTGEYNMQKLDLKRLGISALVEKIKE